MEERVLIIDDDRKLCDLLTTYLSQLGFDVQTAQSGDEGLRLVRAEQPDIVVLDIMLPGMDGFEICRTIRGESAIPILMLTARGEVTDRVVGLELGADDYLPKPFEPRELVARMRAILRRGKAPDDVWQSGDLRIDRTRRAAYLNDEALPLTTAEFDLLDLLARSRGRVLSRTAILDAVRDQPWDTFDRSIDVLVSRLRQKLSDDARHPKFIRTVRGAGYAFVGE